MKREIATCFTCLCSALVAAQPQQQQQAAPQPTFYPGEPLDPKVVPSGLVIPDHAFRHKPMAPYATAYFIWWKANTLDNEVGEKTNEAGTVTSRLIFKTKYGAGFRVGLGADVGALVLDATYTRFHKSYTTHFDNRLAALTPTAVGLIAELQTSTIPSFRRLKSHFLIHWDELALTGQKEIFVRPKMVLKASFGLDSMLSKQMSAVNASNPGSGLVKSMHKFWGVGPLLGMRLRGVMPYGFMIMGNLEFSLQYLRWLKGDSFYRFTTSHNPYLNNTMEYKGLSANFAPKQEATLALQWEKTFTEEGVRVNISAGYTAIAMWLLGPSFYDARLIGDTYFHGLQLGGQVDF